MAPEVYSLDSQDNGFADVWHTDVTFVRRPPAISVLRAVVLPPNGGDTNWADSQLAYESLLPGLRKLVDPLTAVHDGTREFGYYLAQRRKGRGNLWEGQVFTDLTPVEHPVSPSRSTSYAIAGDPVTSPCGTTAVRPTTPTVTTATATGSCTASPYDRAEARRRLRERHDVRA